MKKRILVVDDNEMMREFLLHLLGERFKARGASSSEEAIAFLSSSELPDLVLTDLNMSGKSGLELLKEIKRSPRTAHIPVIFLSSKNKSEYRIESLKYGANDFIIKPFNPVELQLRIEKALTSTAEGILV